MSSQKKRGRPTKQNTQSSTKKKVKGAQDFSLYQDIAQWLRIDCINAVHVTKTGHPTSCASSAQIFSVLFFHQEGLKFHPKNTNHFLNDRFVLSKGHAAPILYAAFYRAGVITEEQLMSLRKKNSIIQGHPVPKIPFVDVATGSLGQGLSMSAGMAYSSKYYDKIKNRIFCLVGDGQLAEGSIWEGVDFARNYQLNNLILFADINRLGQSQETMLQHDLKSYYNKFLAFGWNTLIIDGHNIEEIVDSLKKTHKQTKKPTVVLCKTFKGKNFGQNIQDKLNWHGKDLGNNTQQVIANIKGTIRHQDIQFKTFAPVGDDISLQKGQIKIQPDYNQNTQISTRQAYGNALTKARDSNSNVVGLDGDTKNSTFSIKLKNKYQNSFIQCFIAEQNLVGVAIGLSCRNKIPFCSTFAAFFSRAADQIRIAGIGSNAIKLVGSHSGCDIGEDGPSQMSLQDLGFFRNIPKGVVLVPSDGVSTEKAVQLVGNYNDGPAFIRTSRPAAPIIYKNNQTFKLGKSKVIAKSSEDNVVLFSYGFTIHQCLKAYQKLNNEGIKVRVVDLFSLKPFDSQGVKKHIQQCKGQAIVVEQHYESGGAYQAVCGSSAPQIKKIYQMCVKKIPGSAKQNEQLQLQNLDANSIIVIVKNEFVSSN